MANVLNMFLLAGESITRLVDVSVVVWIMYILGLIFVCVELFIPGFGFFGISGIVLLVASIITLIVQGAEFLVILWLLMIAIGVIAVAVAIMATLLKSGKLKSAIFNIGNSVPTDRTEGTQDFSHLIGKVGQTKNFLRPIGQVIFDDGEIVDVIARSGVIDADTKVIVVSVEGQAVKVDQVKVD